MQTEIGRRSLGLLLSNLILLFIFIACAGSGGSNGNGDGDPVYTETTCTSTINDSTENPDGSATRIVSHLIGSPTYHNVETRRTAADVAVFMDYMVHEPMGTPDALLVLIAGGKLNAGIAGSGASVTASGGNFLVRSAHLFASMGYRVVTIDRPTDYPDWIGTGTFSSEFDIYRIAVNHAVDLSRVIDDALGADDLPVVICGTSRGAISAVNQHFLSDAISISSPVTTGGGTPVGMGAVLPADISKPAHVLWHALDGCWVTPPAGSIDLLSDFPTVSGDELDGGFADIVAANPCGALDYHGFLGIESCAVGATTDWVASLALPNTHPEATSVTVATATDTPVSFDLSGEATAASGGALTYSLPFDTTSLGGTVSMSGTTVTYTPPAGVTSTADSFVYLVSEAGGGTSHSRVVVPIFPVP